MITATAKRGDLIETVTATGSIAAQTGAEVKIGSQITGVIKRLYTDVGRTVKAGDLIAELDLPDLQAQLQQAQANLAAAETRLGQQQTTYQQTLLQTPAQIEASSASVQSARQKLAAAQAAASQQKETTPADVQRAQTTLNASTAALSTANSNLNQVQAGANLTVANAQEQLKQAQANAATSAAQLTREQQLFDKGYVSQADLDTAKQNSTVNQSQVLSARQNVTLTEQKVAADIQSAKDQVTQAQQNVIAARAGLKAAQSETYTVTSRQADVSDAAAALAQAQANYQVIKANLQNNTLRQQDIKAAQDAVNQSRAQVAYNQAQLNKSFIRSPISGTVLQLASQQGETLAAGLSAPTLIIVADLDRLEVDAYVDETDIGKVKVHQRATVNVDAFPDTTFKGRVTKVASGSTIQQGVVTYLVTVAIDDTKHELKPDMTASITIQTGKRANVVLVPSVAVQVGTRGSSVYVMQNENGKPTPKQVPVQTGGTDGVNTEIVSGVNDGDTIVLAGATQSGRGGFGPQSPFGPRQQRSSSGGGGGAGGGGGGGGGGRGGGGRGG